MTFVRIAAGDSLLPVPRRTGAAAGSSSSSRVQLRWPSQSSIGHGSRCPHLFANPPVPGVARQASIPLKNEPPSSRRAGFNGVLRISFWRCEAGD